MTVYQNQENCCGCTACYSACPVKAITMETDAEGFQYPLVDMTKCIHCELCKKLCPLQESRDTAPNQLFLAAAKHKSDAVRKSSSSGGAFSAISDRILAHGGVVYGAVYTDTLSAHHVRAVNAHERDAMHGSKYVQSNLEDTFHAVQMDLEKGMEVLFSGTPCQVDGLKRFLRKNYANLVTLDLICHGVPSPCLFSEHLSLLEKEKHSKVTAYNFRYKAMGWHHQADQVFFENGKTAYGTPLVQSYKLLFYKSYTVRPSCYSCHYANRNRPGDITLGDFWGVENDMPDYNDDIGVSLILVNSSKGKEILDTLRDTMDWRVSETTGVQPHLIHPAKRPNDYDAFWTDYQAHGYAYVTRKYARNNFEGKAKYIVKRILRKIGG